MRQSYKLVWCGESIQGDKTCQNCGRASRVCRTCIEQIDDVVEEEEDEVVQAERLNSNAEASTSDSQVTVSHLHKSTNAWLIAHKVYPQTHWVVSGCMKMFTLCIVES